MKPSTKRLLSLIISLVMVFAGLVIYFNYTTQEYTNADVIRSDVFANQQLLTSQQNAVTQVKKLIADYSGTTQLQDVVSLALPMELDQSGVFNQVQRMAALNKLSLQSFTVAAPIVQNLGTAASSTAIIRPIGNMTSQFRVVGAYGDFKNFLSNLETNIRMFDVKNISVDPLAKPNMDFYGFDVTVVAYYQTP